MQIIINIIHKHTIKTVTVFAVDRNAWGRATKNYHKFILYLNILKLGVPAVN